MASNLFQPYSFNANAAYTGDAVDCSQCGSVAIQCVGTNLGAADGTIKLQKSVDGTTFADVASATTVAASGTAYIIENNPAACAYYRIIWAKGSNAAGTVSVKLLGKA